MSTIAVFLMLGGTTAVAAGQLGKDSVGSRQLKAKSVTTGKIANDAVNGSKVASRSLTGADINVAALGTVPEASHAGLGGQLGKTRRPGFAAAGQHHSDQRPLLRLGPEPGGPDHRNRQPTHATPKAGSFRPRWSCMRHAASSASGRVSGRIRQFTNIIYGDTNGGNYRTMVIDGSGAITEAEINVPSRYTCAYSLVH